MLCKYIRLHSFHFNYIQRSLYKYVSRNNIKALAQTNAIWHLDCIALRECFHIYLSYFDLCL